MLLDLDAVKVSLRQIDLREMPGRRDCMRLLAKNLLCRALAARHCAMNCTPVPGRIRVFPGEEQR